MAPFFHDGVMTRSFPADKRIGDQIMSEHHSDGMTRRDVLIGAASGLALAAIEPGRADAQASPASQVSGTVFEDKDGSGVSSPANPGLPGVLVSNGRDVAVTGLQQRYLRIAIAG